MLEARDVTKRYGALTAVSQVSFTVKPGEVLGYLGPNGSGKSTTVKMLVGLMAPTHGQMFLDGTDIQDDLLGYKAQVGYVPEEAHVYPYLTGPEYLRLVGRLRDIPPVKLERKIRRFLRIFGLDSDYHAQLASYSIHHGAEEGDGCRASRGHAGAHAPPLARQHPRARERGGTRRVAC